MEKLKVKLIFPIKEKQQLYINLEVSSEFNFTKIKPSYLCFGNEKISVKYLGLSNINGTPVAVVSLDDSKYTKVEEIGELNYSDMFIEYEKL
jgi:hypothetical protein